MGKNLEPKFIHIFFSIYAKLWTLVAVFLKKHKRLKENFVERKVPDTWAKPVDIWLQAASGGEAYLIKELLNILSELYLLQENTQNDLEQKIENYLTQKNIHFPKQENSKNIFEFSDCLKENMHAASKNILNFLGTKPMPKLLLSTYTLQGREVLEQAALEFSQKTKTEKPSVRYFPLDHPDLMQKALSLCQAKLIVLLETELWPGLLFRAKQNNIPVFIANGRITEKSLKNYKFLPNSFWHYLKPEAIFAISQEDLNRFATLFCLESEQNTKKKLKSNANLKSKQKPEPHPENNNSTSASNFQVVPNIKFECLKNTQTQAKTNASTEASNNFNKQTTLPLITFGSVRLAELEPIAETIKLLLAKKSQKNKSEFLLILVPRHLHHVCKWRKYLEKQGLCIILASELSTPELQLLEPNIIYIWDKFGQLETLYKHSTAVFVGGSLKPLGGQNFLEPLKYGLKPCIGPFYSNFSWAEDLLTPWDLVQLVSSPENLADYLYRQINSDPITTQKNTEESRNNIKNKFTTYLQSKQGASLFTLKKIFELILSKKTMLDRTDILQH